MIKIYEKKKICLSIKYLIYKKKKDWNNRNNVCLNFFNGINKFKKKKGFFFFLYLCK